MELNNSNRHFFLKVVPIILLALAGTSCGKAPDTATPKLVVLIAVDQMKGDYFDQYDAALTGGLRKIKDEGFRFKEAYVNHAITNSVPGHITLATGKHPKTHGVVDSSWVSKIDQEWVEVSALRDGEYKILGAPSGLGVSPKKIIGFSLPDYFLDQNPSAKTISIGTGSESSLLHGGKKTEHAYWYSISAAAYVTSSYYRNELPTWLTEFNAEKLPKYLDQTEWPLTVEARFADLAQPDDSPYEGRAPIGEFGEDKTFPHLASEMDNVPLAQWHYFAPIIDEATFALAKTAIKQERLGQRAATDYLSITLSTLDHIGHRYGPDSLEQLDAIMRLDQQLDHFLDYLDEMVGVDNYVIALRADHGVSTAPELARARGSTTAQRLTVDLAAEVVSKAVSAANESPLLSSDEQQSRIITELKQFPFIKRSIMVSELELEDDGADAMLSLYRNSYRPNQIVTAPFSSNNENRTLAEFELIVVPEEFVVVDYATGMHGSPHNYDRHVPLIFFGKGVLPGESESTVATVDIAPTLADLGGVRITEKIDGRSLISELKNK